MKDIIMTVLAQNRQIKSVIKLGAKVYGLLMIETYTKLVGREALLARTIIS